jgi:hypothetical protein
MFACKPRTEVASRALSLTVILFHAVVPARAMTAQVPLYPDRS